MWKTTTILIAALALLLPPVAGAATAPSWFTNFSQGTIAGPDWTTVGTPTVTYASGQWWVQLNPADNTAEYAQHAITGTPTTYTEGLALRITTAPYPTGFTLNEVELVTFLGASSAKQIILTLGSDRRLRLHFKDLLRECSSNGQYPYSSCTMNADCPIIAGGFAGESSCEEATYARSDVLTLGATYRIGVSSTPGGTAIVLGSLYVNGIARGTKPRWEGRCVGGVNSGRACGENTDCPASTCASTDISALTAVRFGTNSTTGKAFDVLISDAALTAAVDESEGRYFRSTTIVPDTDFGSGTNLWTNNGCTGGQHFDCVNEATGGTAPDGDTTHLSTSVNGHLEQVTLNNPAALGTGESWVAAALNGTFRTGGTNSAANIGFRNGLTGALTLGAITIDGAAGAWRLQEGPVIGTMPGTGAALAPNDLQARVVTTSAITARMSSVSAELMIALPGPTLSSVFPDVNGDGEDTVPVCRVPYNLVMALT